MKLRDIMSAPVLTLGASEPASDALARMADARVRHGVVLSRRAVIGVVSERDLGGPSGGLARRRRTVGELMVADPVVAAPDMTIVEAALLLRERAIGCLPVVEKGVLVGIVTRGDVLAALATRRRRTRTTPRREHTDPPRPPFVVTPSREKRP